MTTRVGFSRHFISRLHTILVFVIVSEFFPVLDQEFWAIESK